MFDWKRSVNFQGYSSTGGNIYSIALTVTTRIYWLLVNKEKRSQTRKYVNNTHICQKNVCGSGDKYVREKDVNWQLQSFIQQHSIVQPFAVVLLDVNSKTNSSKILKCRVRKLSEHPCDWKCCYMVKFPSLDWLILENFYFLCFERKKNDIC